MDAVLRRLDSIRQSIEHVITLSADEERKMHILLRDINKTLQSRKRYHKDTVKSVYNEVGLMFQEIECLLFSPVVNHLKTRKQFKDWRSKCENKNKIQDDYSAPTEQTNKNTTEKLNKDKTKNKLHQDETEEELISGIADTAASYWQQRRDRIHNLLGYTSLKFDNKCLKTLNQKSLSYDSYIPETKKESPCNKPKITQLISSKEGENYSEDLDVFWGLNEDTYPVIKNKKWTNGETICVLNCKSEIRKLTEFSQEKKAERSFYIERKPNGLAGCKGTWLTPPYLPPLVVKYGCPKKTLTYSVKNTI